MKHAPAWAALSAAVALLVSPSGSRADDSAESFRVHVQRAKDLYSRGSYEAAAEEYVLAYQINPVPGALFNIAQAYRQAGKYEQARKYFRSYLREKKPGAAERKQVEKQISELNGLIAAEKKNGAFEPPAAKGTDDFSPPVVASAKPPAAAPAPIAKKKADDDFAPPVVAVKPGAPTPVPTAKKKTDDDFAPPVVAPKPVPAPAPVVVARSQPAAPAPIAKKKTADDFAPPPPAAVIGASPTASAPVSNRKSNAAPAPVAAHDDFSPPPPPQSTAAKVSVASPPPAAAKPPAAVAANPKPHAAESSDGAVPADAVVETQPSGRSHALAYATGGVALALLGTGFYFGVQAARADNELTAGAHSRADADSLINKSHNDHRLEAVFIGVSAAAVVGAGLLYFLPASGPSGGSGAAVAGRF